MIKWVVNKWYNHSPECMCGYKMKPFEKWTDDYQSKCIWKKCGWEAFDNGNGKLHWWKKSEKKA